MAEQGSKTGKKDRKLLLLLIGGAVGVCFLLFGSMGTAQEEQKENEALMAASDQTDPAAYEEEVEKRVEEICSRVRGAGTVHAVVTLKGGYRAVYATDSRSSSTGYQNDTVLIGSGASEGAVLICYENPEISGIGIVCTGGDDPRVKESVLSLVSAAFDIGTNKIYVAAG